MATQHAGLTPEDWARYSRDHQLLSIAAEMNRGRKQVRAGDAPGIRLLYERVLNLAELTIAVRTERALRRELLVWRDLVAELYLEEQPDSAAHDRAFRALLALTPAGYVQIGELLGE